MVGLDLNFNKHWNHGLELRWFDQIPVVGIREVLRGLVAIGDFSLDVGELPDPRNSEVWKRVTKALLMSGTEYVLAEEDVVHWLTVFRCKAEKKAMTVSEIYETIIGGLVRKYQDIGVCSKSFCRGETRKSDMRITPVEVVTVSPNLWCC